MFTINTLSTVKQEIRKSNFLSYLVPMSEFENFHLKLKEEHPKAVHIVWAYRHYNKYLQIVENQSDDGEPKGTSGPPALNALRGANLIECGVFIVRYFGGIKLGTGGLVRAYSSSVNLAIDEAKLLPYELKDEFHFFVPFALISRFEHFLTKEELKADKEFNENGAFINLSLNLDEFKKLFEFTKPFLIQGVEFLCIPIFAKEIFEK
ncbi:putative translation regulator, IMPACT family (UPF0029 domain) [Campylobacter blaseri]|uniref:Phosphoenolpyruvate carboxykinase n=1 Tax=Campylobacter blaseri TaxID=2042961 RepID=A0A2P8QZ30_9BACT|nr:YigZ family protein [Campylobacter blaseri]PSM51503.1 phosphoenolpyruvate carboxykinase [Campylobacter blaseri]PSM52952.1 phosphoenolpyruvate carboxykinase [Campylobacter blaseri]QKF86486.1 putative translation regulator, IMPACT family (UPF0029 domain) [Campylobacter blaseri]